MTDNLYEPDCIRTFTGIYMNVFEPTEDMICIEDIAHALSHQPRFAGHLPEFYSVAQHSYHCCQMADEDDKLEALLHDASEAYLLDMPKPIKDRLPDYCKIEDNLMRVIASKFRFDYPKCRNVDIIDRAMLHKEWDCLVLRDRPMECWSSKTAEMLFLEMYKKLME